MINWSGNPYDIGDDENMDELLAEFDRMINDTGKTSGKEMKSSDGCNHSWVFVGKSPVLNEDWYDCKICGITKEKYEHSIKYD